MASSTDHKLAKPKLSRRPPKTSRDEIIATALTMLREDPKQELSIHKLASRLNITPRAFYNHLENKNELMQAVAHEALSGLTFEPMENSDWETGIRNWANAFRNYFIEHPYLTSLLAWEGHTSARWLEHQAILWDLLPRPSHLSGREHMQIMQWVQQTVLSTLIAEIGTQKINPDIDPADISRLSPKFVERIQEMLPLLKTYDQSTHFEFSLSQLIAALKIKLENAPASADEDL